MTILPALLLALTLAEVFAVVWMFRRWIYGRFFRYDRRGDQRYDFERSTAIQTLVDIGPDGFMWPDMASPCDTALLEITVDAKWSGQWSEPWIEVRSRHFYARQYFERGAKGQRYLNLDALLTEALAPGQRVWLHGYGLKWSAQQARLIAFENALPAKPRVVVIAPHPDDAEIAAFGLYRRFDSTVVTITDGALGSFYRGQLSEGDPRGPEITARIRAWDSITAPFFGNVYAENAINLGYPDAALEEMFSSPEKPAIAPTMNGIRALNRSPLIDDTDVAPTWRALVTDLGRVFEKVKPDLIVIPHPSIDDHPDHAFSAVAVCEALSQSSLTAGQLLLYTNHSPHSNLHPVGRNDGTVSLPPHFGEPLEFQGVVSLSLTADDMRAKLLAIEAHHDLRALPALKKAGMLKVIRTFVAGLRNHITGLDAHATGYFRRAVRPNEIFFTTPFRDAAWLSSEFLAQRKAGKIAWHVFK